MQGQQPDLCYVTYLTTRQLTSETRWSWRGPVRICERCPCPVLAPGGTSTGLFLPHSSAWEPGSLFPLYDCCGLVRAGENNLPLCPCGRGSHGTHVLPPLPWGALCAKMGGKKRKKRSTREDPILVPTSGWRNPTWEGTAATEPWIC